MASYDTQTQGSTPATQRGPASGPTSMMISGVKVDFPCRAYPSQMAMMAKVIQGLKTGKNCLLESPTGSGKSLALLCAALAWQRHEASRVMEYNAEIDARQEAAMEQERIAKKMRQSAEKVRQESATKDLKTEEVTNKGNENQDSDSSFDVSMDAPAVPVYDITDDDDDDFKPAKRSRTSLSSSLNVSNYTSDSSSDTENVKLNAKVKKVVPQTNTEEDSPYFVPAEKKLTVPKIFFGTRTHKQISQITRELRKTSYRNVRSIILASRDHTCVNPTVERLSNKNEACRELLQNASTTGNNCLWHGGARKLASFGALSTIGLSPAYDVEDLVAIGRKHRACPYYVTRFLMPNADIIFCPYNYIVDPSIRKSMNLELEGHVVIFDEAHNMEDASRESSSFSLKQDDMQRAMQDCEKVARCGNEPYAHTETSKLLSTLSQWMDMQEPQLKEKTFNNSGKCWTGTDFLGSVFVSGITEESIKLNLSYFAAIMEQRDKQMEAQKERGGRWFDEKPVIASQSVQIIESVFRIFLDLCKDNGRYRGDFRVAITKDMVRRHRDGNSGPMRSVQVLTLHLWCLNPAVAFEFVREHAHSIVLTSGTLSPMLSFESELGTPFPLKLEASHVIEKSQCWAAVVGTGPNGGNLNGAFANAATLKYQDELGMIVYRVCQVMPHGVLCFFPSYKMLENMATRWRTTGLLDQIQTIKTVVLEPRSGPDMFQEAMQNFYEAVSASTKQRGDSSMTGALFLAVCRGKVSEGLDFADNNARAVICVGIPFPNIKDMQVELKREYNSRNTSRGLLSGGDWYEIQAFRALNQALGRCIRHRNDWGAILLIDDRYIRQPRYVTSLSKWIRSSVRRFDNWSSTENSLLEFRNGMLSIESHLASDENTSMSDEHAEKCTHDGACNCIRGVVGMNNDVKGHSKPFVSGKENSTTALIPFANSFSSCGDGNNDNDSGIGQHPAQSKAVTPSSPAVNEKSPNTSFKLPNTPLSIFSTKTNQGSKRVEKPNLIASMFAKQIQKTPDETEHEFNPTQVAVGIGHISVPDDVSESTSTNRSKRPREQKLKL